jgi:hypothetical protein
MTLDSGGFGVDLSYGNHRVCSHGILGLLPIPWTVNNIHKVPVLLAG